MSKNVEPITFLKKDDDPRLTPAGKDFRVQFSDPNVTPPDDNDSVEPDPAPKRKPAKD